jgi:hypothetical protein
MLCSNTPPYGGARRAGSKASTDRMRERYSRDDNNLEDDNGDIDFGLAGGRDGE